MKPIGIFLTGFGIMVILFPQIVAILIGVLLILIGTNILFADYLVQKGNSSSFRFGDYEIFKKKK